MYGKPDSYKGGVVADGGEGKPKSALTYMAGCALILYFFVVEHIPASGTNLIDV